MTEKMSDFQLPEFMEVQPQLRELAEVDKDEILNIISQHNLDLIGYGGECVVVAQKLSEPSETVIALNYKEIQSPQEAKETFYTSRILSTLFPHNFPRFMKTYGAHELNKYLSGSERQRINLVPTKKEFEDYRDLDNTAEYPFKIAANAIKELEMPIYYDDSITNYRKGVDGGVYYLDKTGLNKSWTRTGEVTYGTWNIDKVEKYMNEKGYSDIDKKIVLKSIERLQQLRKEAENTN